MGLWNKNMTTPNLYIRCVCFVIFLPFYKEICMLFIYLWKIKETNTLKTVFTVILFLIRADTAHILSSHLISANIPWRQIDPVCKYWRRLLKAANLCIHSLSLGDLKHFISGYVTCIFYFRTRNWRFQILILYPLYKTSLWLYRIILTSRVNALHTDAMNRCVTRPWAIILLSRLFKHVLVLLIKKCIMHSYHGSAFRITDHFCSLNFLN